MTVKQEENLNVMFLLLIALLQMNNINHFVKIHFLIESFIMMLLVTGMIFLAYRRLLRAKQNGESLTKHQVILGFFAFAIVLGIVGTILLIMGHYKL